MEALRPGTGSRSEEGVTSSLLLETEAAHLTAMAVARLVAVQAHQNRARQEGTPLQPEREDAVGVGPIMEEVRVGVVAIFSTPTPNAFAFRSSSRPSPQGGG